MRKKYEECAVRLEDNTLNAAISGPPTKEFCDDFLEKMREGEVEGAWTNATDGFGRALFPSNVYPKCHSRANLEIFNYLIERVHNSARTIIAWLSFSRAIGVTEAHPDWQMRFIDKDGKVNPEGTEIYPCLNSPYGKLLPEFAKEVIEVLDFDGIWFDHFGIGQHSDISYVGCVCNFCSQRFKKDTGLDLPRKVDYKNRNFRIWVNWRYNVLMDVWKRTVKAVESVNSEATVCFNNYRRRHTNSTWTWNTGIPMRRVGLNAVMSGELDSFPFQADIQMKINQAYGLKKGVESWLALKNYYSSSWAPSPDKLTAVQAMLGCISAAGVASYGTKQSPKQIVPLLREVEKAVTPRFPCLNPNGKLIEYATIIASQQTMDFWAKDKPNKVWDEIHGANEILLHSHLPSSVIFEDDLEKGELSKYPLILLGNMVCISEKQAEKLREYVEAGGTLFACDKVGELDELGYPYNKPILDDLLGIVSRGETKGFPILEIKDEEFLSLCKTDPYVFLNASHIQVKASSDVAVLGQIYDRTTPRIRKKTENWPGVWTRSVGKGNIMYMSASPLGAYLREPTPAIQQFFHALLTLFIQPKITLEAPLVVTMNVREHEIGTWAVYLHNNPGSSYRYPNPPNTMYSGIVGELIPIRDIIIKVNTGLIQSAKSALSNKSFEIIDGNKVIVPELPLQDIILFTFL